MSANAKSKPLLFKEAARPGAVGLLDGSDSHPGGGWKKCKGSKTETEEDGTAEELDAPP